MNTSSLHQKIDEVLRRLKQIEARLDKPSPASLPTPNTNRQSEPSPRTKRVWWLLQAMVDVKNIWTPVSVLLAVLGGLSAYTSLRYDVSVSYLTTTDPSAAFESRFLVTNDSPFSIYNVSYFCGSAHVRLQNGQELTNITAVPVPLGELHAHASYSVRCQHPLGRQRIADGAFLEIHALYTPKFFPWLERQGGQQFVLKNDSQGNAIWLPTGMFTKTSHELENEIANP